MVRGESAGQRPRSRRGGLRRAALAQALGSRGRARAAAHHRRGDEAGRRRATAQSGRPQQLRPVAPGALRTVARRDGDHYVVKGHKIWTSLAHKAKVGVLVARTEPDLPKHQGLSEFLIDMDSPGLTVRPIIDMSGDENEYNEVFLDEVRVPADRLLGKEREGCALSMTQLPTDRVALSQPGALGG